MPDLFLISGLLLSRAIARPWPDYSARFLYFLAALRRLGGCCLAAALSLGSAIARSSKPAGPKLTKEAAAQIIQSRPKEAHYTAQKMLDKYGPPHEATPTQLTWFGNGPWKRTVVQKEEIDHKFPMPHKRPPSPSGSSTKRRSSSGR